LMSISISPTFRRCNFRFQSVAALAQGLPGWA
jgi:hypothetical protein